jgi:hypothetical protein
MLGEIVSGIGSIAGSIFGGNNEASRQKKFAQNQIQWRVEDARKAGIHPIFALGATPMQYSPQAVGDIGSSFAEMGQNISRSRMAAADRAERAAVLAASSGDRALARYREGVAFDLATQRGQLENQLLASQIATLSNGQLPPPNPAGSRGIRVPAGTIAERPAGVEVGSAYNNARAPGAITSYQFQRTDDGGLSVMQSEQSKERTEDDTFAQLDWGIRNRLMPWFRGLRPPPLDEYPLPSGQQWIWDPMRQAFYPGRRSGRTRRRGNYSQRPGNF